MTAAAAPRPPATVTPLFGPGDLTTRCRDRLKGVDERLALVVELARKTVDFIVVEGLRTKERQAVLFKAGKSKTMKSKHLVGRAVDIAPLVNGQVSWFWKDYPPMAEAMKDAARKLSVGLVWGGDWVSFKDGPHFELEEPKKTPVSPKAAKAAKK